MKTPRHLLVVVLILIGTATKAQQNHYPGGESANMKDRIAANIEALELSEDQRAEFLEISRRYGEQMKALRNSNANRMEKYQELKSIRKDKNREMKALLSKDQYKLYKEMQARNQQEMKQRRLNRP